MKINFHQINIYIIYLLPFLLITGPFLPDLAISIMAILYLFKYFKSKVYELILDNFFLKFFIFYCLYFIFCSFFADELLISLKSSLFYFRFGVLSLCIYLLLKENPNIISKFFYILFALVSLITIDGFTQLIFGQKKYLIF